MPKWYLLLLILLPTAVADGPAPRPVIPVRREPLLLACTPGRGAHAYTDGARGSAYGGCDAQP